MFKVLNKQKIAIWHLAIWQNWCFGQFEGWKKVEIGLFLLASYAPRNLATGTRVILMGLKYAQKPWEGSELPLASEMCHSFYGKPGYTNYATFIILCLICALNSIIGNAILCPVPCKKAGLDWAGFFQFFTKARRKILYSQSENWEWPESGNVLPIQTLRLPSD